MVLESSGSSSAIDLALHLARRQGRVVLVGSPAGPANLIDPFITDRLLGQAAPALYDRLLSERGDALGVILDWTGEAAN